MTPAEAVELLDGLPYSANPRPNGVHIQADEILLAAAQPDVRAAYERLRGRVNFRYAR